MKFKLVEYPYGREIGFKQDIVWFIQGTDDNKTWNNYVWRDSPAIVYEKEVYHRPPMSAYLTIEDANEAFDITNLNTDIIIYAMTNDNPCVYKQMTR